MRDSPSPENADPIKSGLVMFVLIVVVLVGTAIYFQYYGPRHPSALEAVNDAPTMVSLAGEPSTQMTQTTPVAVAPGVAAPSSVGLPSTSPVDDAKPAQTSPSRPGSPDETARQINEELEKANEHLAAHPQNLEAAAECIERADRLDPGRKVPDEVSEGVPSLAESFRQRIRAHHSALEEAEALARDGADVANIVAELDEAKKHWDHPRVSETRSRCRDILLDLAEEAVTSGDFEEAVHFVKAGRVLIDDSSVRDLLDELQERWDVEVRAEKIVSLVQEAEQILRAGGVAGEPPESVPLPARQAIEKAWPKIREAMSHDPDNGRVVALFDQLQDWRLAIQRSPLNPLDLVPADFNLVAVIDVEGVSMWEGLLDTLNDWLDSEETVGVTRDFAEVLRKLGLRLGGGIKRVCIVGNVVDQSYSLAIVLSTDIPWNRLSNAIMQVFGTRVLPAQVSDKPALEINDFYVLAPGPNLVAFGPVNVLEELLRVQRGQSDRLDRGGELYSLARPERRTEEFWVAMYGLDALTPDVPGDNLGIDGVRAGLFSAHLTDTAVELVCNIMFIDEDHAKRAESQVEQIIQSLPPFEPGSMEPASSNTALSELYVAVYESLKRLTVVRRATSLEMALGFPRRALRTMVEELETLVRSPKVDSHGRP